MKLQDCSVGFTTAYVESIGSLRLRYKFETLGDNGTLFYIKPLSQFVIALVNQAPIKFSEAILS